MDLNEDIRKIFLAGIGAVAVTYEKSKDLVDSLIEKGELTVEQGKIINEELKRKVQKTSDKHATEDLKRKIQGMSQDQIAELKKMLADLDEKAD